MRFDCWRNLGIYAEVVHGCMIFATAPQALLVGKVLMISYFSDSKKRDVEKDYEKIGH